MPTEKRYEINELTDTESTADAGNMLNGKAVVDEPTVTEFTEIESMDEIIKLFGVFDENLKIIEAETGTNIAADSEKINISGKQSAVDIARNVVEKLLSLIKRGESIDRGRIRYAIDLAREGNSELILELADDVIAFTSKGKQIKCKNESQGSIHKNRQDRGCRAPCHGENPAFLVTDQGGDLLNQPIRVYDIFGQDNVIFCSKLDNVSPPPPDFLHIDRNVLDKLIAGFPQAREHHKHHSK